MVRGAVSPQPWDLYARCLQDYWRGQRSASHTVIREDGFTQVELAGRYFVEPSEFPPHERLALDLCKGDVWDIGAGAGRHSLELQRRGHQVRAIDVSPSAVALMRERGVREAVCTDALHLPAGTCDTILLLMNGIGVVGSLAGLDRFLRLVIDVLRPGGYILLDSFDFRKLTDSKNRAYYERRLARNAYSGQTRYRCEYLGEHSPWFCWLFVDPDTLRNRATRRGYTSRIFSAPDSYNFLAQLLPPTSASAAGGTEPSQSSRHLKV